jgi:uncharacterized protein YbaR (Trm112 family)
MHLDTLEMLQCPFCGSPPSLIDNRALARTATHIESGVLACQCCAFPVVAGIPVMISDDTTRKAMHQLEAGEGGAAFVTLLGLADDPERAAAFHTLVGGNRPATYRQAMALLSRDGEGEYFVYRFSDPTFLTATAILEALTRNPAVRARKVLDLCGGSGHLTRALTQLTSRDQTVLADLFFWKLWVARTFTAPGCETVCCNANHPLPFRRRSFSLAMCSDAFPYIFQKRLMAEEMMRATGEDGVVVMPHLHSALGENFTAGMTLTPQGYVDLFGPLEPRLFKDSELFTQVLDGGPLNLGASAPADTLAGEPALTLIAAHDTMLFRTYDPAPASTDVSGVLAVNPLYRVEHRNGASTLTLTFPTPDYEAEFGACKRYMPASVTVPGDLTAPFDASTLGERYEELRRRHVIIDAPKNYV